MSKPGFRDVLAAVGSGLHAWSLVEMALADLFASLSESHPHEVFGTIISFETRLAICDRLMSLTPLEPLEQAMWLKLSSRLSKSYKKRHELAHFTLGKDAKGNRVIYPFLTTETWRLRNARILSESQIKERRQSFQYLEHAITWFSKQAVRSRMPLQASQMPPLEEPLLVVRLRELASQNPAEQQSPHQPDPE